MKMMKKTVSFATAMMVCLLGVISSAAATIYYADGCYYTFINNTRVSLIRWAGEGTVVRVPAVLNSRRVTNIEPRAFYQNDTITGVDFSNATNLTTIGMYAFANCSAFTEPVVIPETVTTIGDCAFEGTPVPAAEINANTDYIPIQCFNGCATLTQVTVNGPVEEIDNYAFANCPVLEAVYLPSTVTIIADSAFDNDPNLTIYCYTDSYAQTYAEAKGIPYVLLDAQPQEYLLGDANGDGRVNINDVTAIQRHIALLAPLPEENERAGDINGNGEIEINDASELQRSLSEFESDYPIGEIITA